MMANHFLLASLCFLLASMYWRPPIKPNKMLYILHFLAGIFWLILALVPLFFKGVSL